MAYVNPYQPTVPDNAIYPANQIGTAIRNKEQMLVERLTDILGVNFTDDPIVVTKLANALVIATKNAYFAEYQGGVSGTAKTIDIVANGPNQKFILNNNCTFTFPVIPAGATGVLNLVQDGAGGRVASFNALCKFQGNAPPVAVTTPGTSTLWSWYSNGAVIFLFTVGTPFNVA